MVHLEAGPFVLRNECVLLVCSPKEKGLSSKDDPADSRKGGSGAGEKLEDESVDSRVIRIGMIGVMVTEVVGVKSKSVQERNVGKVQWGAGEKEEPVWLAS